MTTTQKKRVLITKPYEKGQIIDKNTVKRALAFLGILLVFTFISVIACSMFLFDNHILRIAMNSFVEILILTICFTNGSSRGTEDVAKGEVIFQHKENGKNDDPADAATAYHPVKGLITAVIGSTIVFVFAVLLAFMAEKTVTGIGALPSWIENYQRRPEIGNALAAYNAPVSVTFVSALRTVVRLFLMPLVSVIGADNKDLMLMLERFSPLLVLLPAIAFGIGYMQGPSVRSKVHTEISENIRKRKKKERKERKKRAAAFREPEQLN